MRSMLPAISCQRRWAVGVGGIVGVVITALYVLSVGVIASRPFDGRVVRAPGHELFAAASYKGVPYLLTLGVLPGVATIAFAALVAILVRRRRWMPAGALTSLVVASYPIVLVGAYAGGYVATTLG